MPRRALPGGTLLGLVLLAACGGAPAARENHDDRVPRRRSVERYVAMLESPSRAEWQRPGELVEALGLRPGMRVADVGTGSGYFLPYLNAAVGPGGRVVAQDIDQDLLEVVRRRAEREGLDRVEPRLGTPSDPRLEVARYDLILMVDVYHHVSDPDAFLSHIVRALAPGGRFVIVDFAPGDHVPEEISGADHRIERQRVLDDAARAGLVLVREHRLIRYQFVLELGRP